MTLQQFFSAESAYRLGGAIIHSLWQGALVAGMLWIILTVFKRRTPQLRYLLLLGALTVVGICGNSARTRADEQRGSKPVEAPSPSKATLPSGVEVERPGVAQATQPADDAAGLYLRAAKIIEDTYRTTRVCSPRASTLNYDAELSLPPEWHRMEASDFAANREARALAHQARSTAHAHWPRLVFPNPDLSYLNRCRSLANDLADAALHQHLQGDDAAAFETLLDQWQLAQSLQDQPDKKLVVLLVSFGIRALALNSFDIVTADVSLTSDPHDAKGLQTGLARELIALLLKHPDVTAQVNEFVRGEGAAANALTQPAIDRCVEQAKRINAENDLAAMSLACHLYRFDKGSWPKALDNLHGYPPSIPIDPWGDGRQTLGYVLIKGGLPGGADRPLVYSRCWLNDGLFFRKDRPAYSFYVGDGSTRPAKEQKRGGQFRDVAAWPSAPKAPIASTTQPLN